MQTFQMVLAMEPLSIKGWHITVISMTPFRRIQAGNFLSYCLGSK